MVLCVTAFRRIFKSFLMDFWAYFNEVFQRHIHLYLHPQLSKACQQLGWQTSKMCILFTTLIDRGVYSTYWFFMYNIWVAAFKSSPLTCSCMVTHCVFVFSMLCIKIEESLAGILSVGLNSNMFNLVWLDLCDCWNIDLSLVAYWQLYFLLKSSIVCCTCCNKNTTLKQEVTLIYTGVHRYWDFYWGW